jgi:hypothetical protein
VGDGNEEKEARVGASNGDATVYIFWRERRIRVYVVYGLNSATNAP